MPNPPAPARPYLGVRNEIRLRLSFDIVCVLTTEIIHAVYGAASSPQFPVFGVPPWLGGVQTSRYRRKLSLVGVFNRLTPTNRRHGRVLARVDGAQKLRPTIIACELITTTLVPICRKYGWVVVAVLDCPRSYAQDRPLEVSSISCPVPRQGRYGFPTW